MSKKDACWDDAVGESVFARIKDDLIYRTTFETAAQAMVQIEDYIENFYNPHRRHSAANRMSPDDFEAARLLTRQTG